MSEAFKLSSGCHFEMTYEELCKEKEKYLNEMTARGALAQRRITEKLKTTQQTTRQITQQARTFPIPQFKIRDSSYYEDLYPDDMTESEFFGGDVGDK